MSAEIIRLYNDKNLYHKISEFNKKDASRFDVKREVAAMAAIYKQVLGDKL